MPTDFPSLGQEYCRVKTPTAHSITRINLFKVLIRMLWLISQGQENYIYAIVKLTWGSLDCRTPTAIVFFFSFPFTIMKLLMSFLSSSSNLMLVVHALVDLT